MGKSRSSSRLNKKRIATQQGYTLCTVNAFGVRELAEHDEEFTNFAIHGDFPGLIAEREIWVDERLFEPEGLFYLANALTRLKERADGKSEEHAYQAGLDVERSLRERLVGVKYRAGRPHRRIPERLYVDRYATLPDRRAPVEVWFIEGNLVRSLYKTDYTEGGHGYVYPWVPKDQIWIEKDLDRAEIPYIVSHEYLELRLMRDKGLEYDRAHVVSAKVEFALREGKPILSLLAPEGRRLTKAALAGLTSDEFFADVLRHHRVG